jgi:adenylate kinase family enzyme
LNAIDIEDYYENAILGYSGSGKSTLAKQLGIRLNIPVLYLDTVQFEANWTQRDRDEALAIAADFMRRRTGS